MLNLNYKNLPLPEYFGHQIMKLTKTRFKLKIFFNQLTSGIKKGIYKGNKKEKYIASILCSFLTVKLGYILSDKIGHFVHFLYRSFLRRWISSIILRL